MTVRELIEALSALDPDKYILIQHEGYAYELDLGDTIPFKNVHEGNISFVELPDDTACYLLETWF